MNRTRTRVRHQTYFREETDAFGYREWRVWCSRCEWMTKTHQRHTVDILRMTHEKNPYRDYISYNRR